MSDDSVTAAISAAATSLESAEAASATSVATAAGATDTSAAVDIPSTEPAAEAVTDPNAQEVAEEAQDPNAPVGHMPLHRHKAVLTNERNKRVSVETQLATATQQLESLRWAQTPDMPDRMRALEIAESNPDLFIQVLKQDPRYAKLLNTPAEQPAQPLQAQAAAHGERPAADRQDDQGNLYYSQEQGAALLEWAEKVQEARTKALLDERFAPVEKERAAAAERHQQEQMWNGAIERQRTVLTDARATWEHFAELEPAIKADLKANPTMSLETAYRRAYGPRAKADRNKMRADILAEINKAAPVAGSLRPGSNPSLAAPGTKSTEDIIADIARGLERKSA